MRIILFVTEGRERRTPSWPAGRSIGAMLPRPRMAMRERRLSRFSETRFRLGFHEFQDDADGASR